MFLTSLPLWLSAILVVGVPVIIAMAGPILVRRCVPLERLSSNNEVAGFKFATIGVLYAVLLGFAVIVVWEKFSDAEGDVVQEAGSAVTVYRLIDGIQGEPGPALRAGLTDYLKLAITQDWPAMDKGRASPAATEALNKLYTTLMTYDPKDRRGAVLLEEITRQVDQMTQARRARLALAAGIVPGIVRLVLIGGAAVTIGFTFFFGTENLRAQTMMTGALTLLIFAALLVIVAIDHPFAGSVKVGPEALVLALEDFSHAAAPTH